MAGAAGGRGGMACFARNAGAVLASKLRAMIPRPVSRLRAAILTRATPAVLIGLSLLLSAGPAAAQYFGRNKVQYENFKFRILRTEHFDIYFYPAEQDAVEDAARMA